MINVTLKTLALELNISVDYLIKYLADIGINKTAIDSVNKQEKKIIISSLLNNNHNQIPNKLILQRKTRQTLHIASNGGKSKSVQIEIRKNKTYIPTEIKVLNKKLSNIKSRNKIKQDVLTIVNNKTSKVENVSKVDYDLNNNNFFKQKNKNNNKINTLLGNSNQAKTITSNIKPYNLPLDKKHDININIINKKINSNIKNNFKKLNSETIINKHNNKRKKINKQKQKKYSYSEFKLDLEQKKNINFYNKKKRKIHAVKNITKIKKINRDVIIGETITVAELANRMAVKSSQVIKVIMKFGSLATINQTIDQETAQLVATEMGHKVILRHENEIEKLLMSNRNINNKAIKQNRAPIVTIMGHVDHGKTSLLDNIRVTKLANNEVGGITQHIGAYHVKTNNGMITFIDTPGHAAFTAMRARGAKITDIIVVVVAADDGVMPQTIEAINHAKAAKVPLIIAINKIDKTGLDIDRIKTELTNIGIIPEEWGGETQFVNVSAKLGSGINKLLAAILVQAEILELKAIHNCMANGVVIESSLNKGSGPVATILVKDGTLKQGDIILCGLEYGRVRTMRDEKKCLISSAGPSIPVEITGLSGVPLVGDEATVVNDEKKAREVALYRQKKWRELKLTSYQHQDKLKSAFDNINNKTSIELNIILKSDTQGSKEAIIDALKKLSNQDVKINIINSGVGGITETDATLAIASNAILIGFNVRANLAARKIIKNENLDLRYYSIIYDLINVISKAMQGMITIEYKQEIIGLAEVRNVFCTPKFGTIAGCMVTEGIVKRHNKIHILRDNIIIYDGELESLRRFKDDVNEVRNGMECGIGIKNYNNIRMGDVIEVFNNIKIKSRNSS